MADSLDMQRECYRGTSLFNSALRRGILLYDLSFFSATDASKCQSALAALGAGATSMEEVAQRLVRYLYEHFRHGADGTHSVSRIALDHRIADLFRSIALGVKLAALPFSSQVFAGASPSTDLRAVSESGLHRRSQFGA